MTYVLNMYNTYVLTVWIFWFLSVVIAMDYSFECNLSFFYIFLLFSYIYFVLFQSFLSNESSDFLIFFSLSEILIS